MFKITPNPPDSEPTSPCEPDSTKLSEAAERDLGFRGPSIADIKATPRTPCTLFIVDPEVKTETLAVFLVEMLASVDGWFITWWIIWTVSRAMPYWEFETASCWRRSRRTGCLIRLIHLSR